MQLIRPKAHHLPGYADALRRGYSPDNIRGQAAADEELAEIAADPDRFIATFDNPLARAGPVTLADGSQVQRLPSFRRWMWSDDDGFVGSIGLRWPAGDSAGPLPAHVLGHIGYAVVPWARNRGHASAALRQLLPLAQAVGLPVVEITTDADNAASQRVIERGGGRLVEHFDKPAVFGGKASLRFRIDLAGDAAAVIRAARAEQTRALADQDLDTVALWWADDIVIRRGMGGVVIGAATARESLAERSAGLVYQRHAGEVMVSASGLLAWEDGRWTGHPGDAAAPAVQEGRYAAQWALRAGWWKIQGEVFVALRA